MEEPAASSGLGSGGPLFSAKTGTVDWLRLRAVDADSLQRGNSEQLPLLLALSDMIIAADASNATKPLLLQLFRASQLLLEVKSKELDRAQQELREAKTKPNALSASLRSTSVDGQARELTRQLEMARMEVRHRDEELERLRADLNDTVNQLADKDEANQRLSEELKAVAEQAERQQQRMEEQLRVFASQSEQQEHQQQLLDAKARHSTALEQQLQTAKATNDRLQNQNDELTSRLQDSIKHMDEASERIASLVADKSRLEHRLKEMQAFREAAEERARDLDNQLRQSTTADTSILEAVTRTVEEWKAKLTEKESELAAAYDVIDSLQQELDFTVRQQAQTQAQLQRQAEASPPTEAEGRRGKSPGRRRSTVAQDLIATQAAEYEKQLAESEEHLTQIQRELAEARGRLAQYEKGYGIEDAVKEVKVLRLRLEQRDKDARSLTMDLNSAYRDLDVVMDENEVLRQQIGVAADHGLPLNARLEDVRAKRENALSQMRLDNQQLRQRLSAVEADRSKLRKRLLAMATNQSLAEAALADLENVLDEVGQESAEAGQSAPSKNPGDDGGGGAQQLELSGESTQQLAKAQKALAELQQAHQLLKVEATHLRSALKETADGLLEAQYRVTAEGSLQEFTLNCPEVKQLLGFYQKHFFSATNPWQSGLPQSAAASAAAGTAGADAQPGRGTVEQHHKPGILQDAVVVYQGEILRLRGANAELRTALKQAQDHEHQSRRELEQHKSQFATVQQRLADLEAANASLREARPPLPLPAHMTATSSDLLASLNEQLLQTLHTLKKREAENKNLSSDLQRVKQEMVVTAQQQALLYDEHMAARRRWQETEQQMHSQMAELRIRAEEAATWQREFLALTNALRIEGQSNLSSGSEARRNDGSSRMLGTSLSTATVVPGSPAALLTEFSQRGALAIVSEATLKRRLALVSSELEEARKQARKLRHDLQQTENLARQRVELLERGKAAQDALLNQLHDDLANSVPQIEVDRLAARTEALATRYRLTLERYNQLQQDSLQGQETALKLGETEGRLALALREVELLQARLKAQRPVAQDTTPAGGQQPGSRTGLELEALTARLADEHQRAELLALQRQQAQDQLARVQARNNELERRLSQLSDQLMESKEAEAALRSQLAQTAPLTDLQSSRTQLAELRVTVARLEEQCGVLREREEIAVGQAEFSQRLRGVQQSELDALRAQLLELQTTTDTRAAMGRLQHQILTLRLSEAEALRKVEQQQRQALVLQRDVSRLTQQLQDKDRQAEVLNHEARNRASHLRARLQALRTQFAGAAPLEDWEQHAHLLEQLRAGKAAVEQELQLARQQRLEAQDDLQRLAEQHAQLKSLTAALGQDRAVEMAREWHSKLGDLKLDNLRLARQLLQAQERVKYLERVQAESEAAQQRLEQETVRLSRQHEEREQAWEQREAGLEAALAQAQTESFTSLRLQRGQLANMPLDQLLPDPTRPIGEQLEACMHQLQIMQGVLKREQADRLTAEHRAQELEVLLKTVQAGLARKEAQTAQEAAGFSQTAGQLRGVRSELAGLSGASGGPASDRPTAAALQATKTALDLLQNRHHRAVTAAQDTLGSLQRLLDTKEAALASLQSELESSQTAQRQLKSELLKAQQRITSLAGVKTAPAASEAIGRAEEPTAVVGDGNAQQTAGVVTRLNQRVQELEDEVAHQRQLLQTARSTAAAAERQRAFDESSRRELQDRMQQELSALQEQQLALKAQLATAESSLAAERKQRAEAEAEARRLATERHQSATGMSEGPKSADSKNKQQSEEDQRLQKQLAELTRKLATAEREASQKQSKTVKELDSAKQELKQAQEVLASSKARATSLESDVAMLKTRLQAADSGRQKAETALKSTQSQLAATRDKLTAAERRLEQEQEEFQRKLLLASKKETGPAAGSVGAAATTNSSAGGENTQEIGPGSNKESGNTASGGVGDQDGGEQQGGEQRAKWEADKKLHRRLDALKAKVAEKEEELANVQRLLDTAKRTVDRLERERDQLQKRLDARPSAAVEAKQLRAENEELRTANSKLRHQLDVDMARELAVRDMQLRELRAATGVMSSQRQLNAGGTEAEAIVPGGAINLPLSVQANELLDAQAEILELRFQLEEARAGRRTANTGAATGAAGTSKTYASYAELQRKLSDATQELLKLKREKRDWQQAQQERSRDQERAQAVLSSEHERLKGLYRQEREARERLLGRVSELESGLATESAAKKQLELQLRTAGQPEMAVTAMYEQQLKQLKETEARKTEALRQAREALHQNAADLAALQQQVQDLTVDRDKLQSELAAFDPLFFDEI